MCHNEFGRFPGRWGELADRLREAHEQLARAGANGVEKDVVVDLSRLARNAVGRAGQDVDLALEVVERVVLDARSLAARSL